MKCLKLVKDECYYGIDMCSSPVNKHQLLFQNCTFCRVMTWEGQRLPNIQQRQSMECPFAAVFPLLSATCS